MAPTVRYPFSQKTRLEGLHVSTFHFGPHLRIADGQPVTYAVRLLMNGILASARRSVLAPAINRSEKCSRAAAMILQAPILVNTWVPNTKGPSLVETYPHPMCSQNLIMPAAKPWQVCARVCTEPRGESYFRATMCIGISLHKSRSWRAR